MDRIVNVGVWCAALVYLGARIGMAQAAGADTSWDAFLAVLVALIIIGHVVEPGTDAPSPSARPGRIDGAMSAAKERWLADSSVENRS